MVEKTHKQAYGTITKKEVLSSYPLKMKEMVLEARRPFPGYYTGPQSPASGIKPPYYLFFIIKPTNLCTEDNIIRITQKIKQQSSLVFDSCPGQLSLFNIMQPHIRIHTSDMDIVPELVEHYKENGIVFQKAKEVTEATSLIRIKKYFELEPVYENVYRAADNPFFRYIRIPRQIDWGSFEKITDIIKVNNDFANYDYALAAFYQQCGFEDYIRIYSEHCDCTKLPELHQLYCTEIEKHLFL